jgi:hypothetical protein
VQEHCCLDRGGATSGAEDEPLAKLSMWPCYFSIQLVRKVRILGCVDALFPDRKPMPEAAPEHATVHGHAGDGEAQIGHASNPAVIACAA